MHDREEAATSVSQQDSMCESSSSTHANKKGKGGVFAGIFGGKKTKDNDVKGRGETINFEYSKNNITQNDEKSVMTDNIGQLFKK